MQKLGPWRFAALFAVAILGTIGLLVGLTTVVDGRVVALGLLSAVALGLTYSFGVLIWHVWDES